MNIVYRKHGLIEAVCRSRRENVRCDFVREVALENSVKLTDSKSADELMDEFLEQTGGMGVELEEV